MSKRLVGVCVAIASIGLSVTSEAQKPTAADKSSHQQMMQGMTEADFVPMMIKHHQDGIQMSQLEETNGASAEVKALAAKIRQAQERDIPELKKHSQHASTATGGHAGHDKMMEPHSQMTMKRLKTASGAALDHAFLEEMAKHHQMAISMTEGAKLQNAELRQFAQKMAAGQRQELAELKKQLAAHGPK